MVQLIAVHARNIVFDSVCVGGGVGHISKILTKQTKTKKKNPQTKTNKTQIVKILIRWGKGHITLNFDFNVIF